MKSILNLNPTAFSKEMRRLKRKFYLLFVLPVIAVLLAVRVLQVYLSIALRKAGTQTPIISQADQATAAKENAASSLTVFGAARPQETVISKPVKKTVLKPQFFTPEPVSQPVK